MLNWFSRWDFSQSQLGIFAFLGLFPGAYLGCNLICLPDPNSLATSFHTLGRAGWMDR